MYYDINNLKKRWDIINKLRINRALSVMQPEFRCVYSLLPILFHLHHPVLPGYLSGNVPYGICCYVLNDYDFFWLKKINSSYDDLLLNNQNYNNQYYPITGIYSMGSTSSIGQNDNSDLDIWVCYQHWLSCEEIDRLRLKCILIKEWAITKGVDIHFFLIDEEKFRHYGDDVNGYSENIKHLLLLDEFYRTAVRMGGKRILWNIIPGEKELYYNEYVLSLYANNILISGEWLDLGTVSIREFFVSNMFKNRLIEGNLLSCKEILKTLLLESYYWNYPHTELLSVYIKQLLHSGIVTYYSFDSYYMMLDRVTGYLITINDMIRLDMVRCCFYLKVCEKLSQKNSSIVLWRRNILMTLVRSWGWDYRRLMFLDNYINWKIYDMDESNFDYCMINLFTVV